MNIEEPKLRETSFLDPNEDGGLGGIDSSNAKGVPNHIPNVWRQEVHMINTGHLRTNKLVGGFNHLEKYESQWEGLSHILWKIKIFQTTNQQKNSALYI